MERFVTFVDLVDEALGLRHVSARLDVVLDDGSRVVVLDDRAWSTSPPRPYGEGGSTPDVPNRESADDIEATARMVVGPDEPLDGVSYDQAEANYWAYLAGILKRQGVSAEAQDLRGLPHDVELSEPVLARVAR